MDGWQVGTIIVAGATVGIYVVIPNLLKWFGWTVLSDPVDDRRSSGDRLFRSQQEAAEDAERELRDE